MSTQTRLRRGTTAQHATFTGAQGEITVDTDKNTVVVQDGVTAGGVPLVNLIALATQVGQMLGMLNGTIVASVAGNALTVAIKTLAGADPSALDPVTFIFRNATSASGDYVKRTVTAALSLVISSGSTMGAANSTAFRLRLVAFDDAGTVRLGLVNTVSGTNVMPLRDDLLLSSTAEGGAGAADSAQVIYTGTAVAAKAQRMLGYLDWSAGLAAVGTWSSGPTKIQLHGPGIALPGQVVQSVRSVSGANASGTTVIPPDNTIPQNTEGDQYMSQAITPTATSNLLRIEHRGMYSVSAATTSIATALFQDSVANALAAISQYAAGGVNAAHQNSISHIMLAGTVVATTFKVRSGPSSAATVYFNSYGGTGYFAGLLNSTLEVQEIMT